MIVYRVEVDFLTNHKSPTAHDDFPLYYRYHMSKRANAFGNDEVVK